MRMRQIRTTNKNSFACSYILGFEQTSNNTHYITNSRNNKWGNSIPENPYIWYDDAIWSVQVVRKIVKLDTLIKNIAVIKYYVLIDIHKLALVSLSGLQSAGIPQVIRKITNAKCSPQNITPWLTYINSHRVRKAKFLLMLWF